MNKLSKETIESLRPAIEATWNSIYADAYDVVENNNLIAMEMVLDSDRLHFAGFDDAWQAHKTLCQQHNYSDVQKELAAAIKLI